MSEIGVFTPDQAERLWKDYLRRQQLNPHVTANYPQRRPVDEVSPHRVFVRNDSGEEIPAYGCLKITGTATVGGRTALTVDKPDSTEGEFVFCSQFAIAIGATGWAYRYGIVVMLGAAPSVACVKYQPIVDSWQVEEGGTNFTVFGQHNADPYALIGRIEGTSSGIVHGIVTAILGCGWYTIELADWVGYRDTYEDCDPFANVTGEGTEDCGITLTIPASQLTGRYEFVTARDPGSLVVPLIVGTDCLLTNLGDVDTQTGDPVWQIVRGQINLIVRYREEWDCCEPGGPETLISRSPDILLGLGGPTIQCGECPY